MRWLAAKTPELGKWGWGPISNGDAIDTLREKMMDLIDDPSKVLNEDFMMNMFQKYVDALPPFKSYLEHLFQKKRMNVVASESGATVLQFAELRTELFSPSDSTNAGTNGRLIELARVAAQGILDELHDESSSSYFPNPWAFFNALHAGGRVWLCLQATGVDRVTQRNQGGLVRVQLLSQSGIALGAVDNEQRQ